MSDPCLQEKAIGKLESTTESIGKTLERLGTVLEQIAAQGTTIIHLQQGQNILFERVRQMEISNESQKVKVGFIMTGISVISAAVTSFLVKHFGGN